MVIRVHRALGKRRACTCKTDCPPHRNRTQWWIASKLVDSKSACIPLVAHPKLGFPALHTVMDLQQHRRFFLIFHTCPNSHHSVAKVGAGCLWTFTQTTHSLGMASSSSRQFATSKNRGALTNNKILSHWMTILTHHLLSSEMASPRSSSTFQFAAPFVLSVHMSDHVHT